MKKTSEIDPAELWEKIELNMSITSRGTEEKESSLPPTRPGDQKPTVGGKHNLERARTKQMNSDLSKNSTPQTTTDSPSLPTIITQPTITINTAEVDRSPFPDNLPTVLDVILGHNGMAYSVRHDMRNLYVLEVGSRALNNIIRLFGQEDGHRLRKSDISEINDMLLAHAERVGIVRQVWYRVAPTEGGVEIDIGDNKHTRFKITTGKVEIIESGSETLFFRTPFCLPMAMPQEAG